MRACVVVVVVVVVFFFFVFVFLFLFFLGGRGCFVCLFWLLWVCFSKFFFFSAGSHSSTDSQPKRLCVCGCVVGRWGGGSVVVSSSLAEHCEQYGTRSS